MSPNHLFATVSVVALMFLLRNSESKEQMDLLNRNWDLNCRNPYRPMFNVLLLFRLLQKVVLQHV